MSRLRLADESVHRIGLRSALGLSSAERTTKPVSKKVVVLDVVEHVQLWREWTSESQISFARLKNCLVVVKALTRASSSLQRYSMQYSSEGQIGPSTSGSIGTPGVVGPEFKLQGTPSNGEA